MRSNGYDGPLLAQQELVVKPEIFEISSLPKISYTVGEVAPYSTREEPSEYDGSWQFARIPMPIRHRISWLPIVTSPLVPMFLIGLGILGTVFSILPTVQAATISAMVALGFAAVILLTLAASKS